MKQTIKISFLMICMTVFSLQAFAVNQTIQPESNIFDKMLSSLTMDEIHNMNTKEIQQAIGSSFTLTEKAGLLLGKYKINRLFKKGYNEDQVKSMVRGGDFSFSIWGFLLGFSLAFLVYY